MNTIKSTELSELPQGNVEHDHESEIFNKCAICKKNRLLAYWDHELEWYMYSSEQDVCIKCLSVNNLSKLCS